MDGWIDGGIKRWTDGQTNEHNSVHTIHKVHTTHTYTAYIHNIILRYIYSVHTEYTNRPFNEYFSSGR